ncbi:unnamed protein product, partial [Nesidiocoris tenuis]
CGRTTLVVFWVVAGYIARAASTLIGTESASGPKFSSPAQRGKPFSYDVRICPEAFFCSSGSV